jgi:hypothetical protein
MANKMAKTNNTIMSSINVNPSSARSSPPQTSLTRDVLMTRRDCREHVVASMTTASADSGQN